MLRERLFFLLVTLIFLPATSFADDVAKQVESSKDISHFGSMEYIKLFRAPFKMKKVVIRGYERTHDSVDQEGEALSFDLSSAVDLDRIDNQLLENWIGHVLEHDRDLGETSEKHSTAGEVVLVKAAKLDQASIGKNIGVLELRAVSMSDGKPKLSYGRPEHLIWVSVFELNQNNEVETIVRQYKGLGNIDHQGVSDYSVVGVGQLEGDDNMHLLLSYRGYYAHTQILLDLKTFVETRYDL